VASQGGDEGDGANEFQRVFQRHNSRKLEKEAKAKAGEQQEEPERAAAAAPAPEMHEFQRAVQRRMSDAEARASTEEEQEKTAAVGWASQLRSAAAVAAAAAVATPTPDTEQDDDAAGVVKGQHDVEAAPAESEQMDSLGASADVMVAPAPEAAQETPMPEAAPASEEQTTCVFRGLRMALFLSPLLRYPHSPLPSRSYPCALILRTFSNATFRLHPSIVLIHLPHLPAHSRI